MDKVQDKMKDIKSTFSKTISELSPISSHNPISKIITDDSVHKSKNSKF